VDRLNEPLDYATPSPPDRARLHRFLRREAVSAAQLLLVAGLTLLVAVVTDWAWWPTLTGVLIGLLLLTELVKRLVFGVEG
jgi:hypothetical protein